MGTNGRIWTQIFCWQ